MGRMSGEDVLMELTPPGELVEKAGIDRSILESISMRKISYPAEIVGDTGINRQTVFDHLRFLERSGKVKRVLLARFVPDEMKERLPELWELGLKGKMIKRMTWYTLVNGDESKKK